MASYCAKCGAELSPDKQFCTACGAAAPAQPSAAQPSAVQPTAAPDKSSGCIKIVLIVVAILAVLAVLALASVGYLAWRVKKAIHIEGGPNGQVSMNIPGTSFSANTAQSFTAAELGTDIYPGAQSVSGGMKMDLPTGSMVTGVFVTSDSKDQVVNFYKGKFGSAASTYDTSDGAIVTLPMGQQESVMVTITAKPSENDGKTKIVILHTVSKKAS
ncbi:MAG: zinc ribbon domain-containing protein [Terracidiphilus sp.]